jgi:hypothetical protein
MKSDGKSLGGINRAKSLSADERKDIASKAASKRWEREREMPKATHRGEVKIEDVIIPCAVLENGVRVISETGINKVLGSMGGKNYRLREKSLQNGSLQDRPLPLFVSSKALQHHIDGVFGESDLFPIEYKDGRQKQVGYPAEILPKVCEVWLRARDAGDLQSQQLPKALKADMLMRGLAHIGIVALVDEVTGYQDDRNRDELHKLLAVYLSNERLAWAKRFPDEFYKQIYRLKDWKWPSVNGQTPRYVGKLTNQLVYEKLPKGVLDELQNRNPTKPGTGQRQWRHHQFLSEDIGQGDLRDHLLQLIAIMRISKNWKIFIANFEAAFPDPFTVGKQGELDIELDED